MDLLTEAIFRQFEIFMNTLPLLAREDYEQSSGTPWGDDDFPEPHLDPEELNDG